MPRNRCLFASILIASAAFLASSPVVADHDASSQEWPNVLVFVVDDLGYMDIGANNPECFYDTPNIDNFAATAMRFTDGYAANPVCSPTRYSLLTGKYPTRVGATNFFGGKRKRAGKFRPAELTNHMPLSEITLAQALKGKGYACLLYTSPSPRDRTRSRMPSSA